MRPIRRPTHGGSEPADDGVSSVTVDAIWAPSVSTQSDRVFRFLPEPPPARYDVGFFFLVCKVDPRIWAITRVTATITWIDGDGQSRFITIM